LCWYESCRDMLLRNSKSTALQDACKGLL